MPYSLSAGSSKRRKRQRQTVPCFCDLCQGKLQSYRVARRHKQAIGKNIGIINQYDSSDEQEEIEKDSSPDSSSDSENFQENVKLREQNVLHNVSEDNSELEYQEKPSGLNKSPNTSSDFERNSSSLHDTLHDSDTGSVDSSVDEDDCDSIVDLASITSGQSSLSDSNSQKSDDDTAESITSVESQKIEEELPLYEGSSTSVLEALAGYFDWFTTHPSVSKSALSELLKFEHENILPPGNNLPSSYEEALKFVRPHMLDTVTYHTCPNDCVIFRKTPRYDFSDLDECPICHAKRFGSNGVPLRKYVYYPLGPRWKRMFENRDMSEVLQSHYSFDESCLIYDVQNSPAWKQLFADDGVFSGDCRGLLIQFSTDGVNPFSSNKVCYSMWPVMVTILNLPKVMRNKYEHVMLAGIIPANGKHEPKSIDPYLEVLVDELMELDGAVFYDAFNCENFKFQVRLHNYVLDYPGLNKTFSCVGAGALQGCMWCELRGRSITIT